MREALFLGDLGKIFIQIAPLFAFTCCRFGKVCLRITDNSGGIAGRNLYCAALEKSKELTCMTQLLIGCFHKYSRNLLIAFFESLLGKECIA